MDSNLSAEMQKKNPVGGGEHLHVRQRPEPGEHLLSMRFALDVEGHVSHHTVGRCRDDIHRAQVGAFFGQDGSHSCKHAWFVGELETNGQTVVGIGPNLSHSWSLFVDYHKTGHEPERLVCCSFLYGGGRGGK